jgi:hypothetical protein
MSYDPPCGSEGQVISFSDNIFGERQRYARPSQTLFFGSILRFTNLDVSSSASLQGDKCSLQPEGEIILEHLGLIWFDTLQEYLVNCQIAVIENGTLP